MACRWRNAAERSKTRGGYGSAKADAFGHYQDDTFGNGVMTFTDFDQASGLMGAREGGVGGGTGLINAAVAWDLNGNLAQRQDLKLTPAVTEVFEYDSLNRFDRSTRNGSQNLDIVLNPSGNITSRQVDVQTPLAYIYTGAQTGCSYYTHTQPRAVRKVGSTVYCYDKNGNMVKRGGSNISYTSYNLPAMINSGSNSSTLSYGAFRNRFKQVAVSGGAAETTLYVAGLFERVTRPSGVIEYRHYLPGGQGTAAIHTRRTTGVNSTYYVHADHLGSPELLTDNAGAALVRPSFAAYGERRDGTDWSGPPSAADLTAIGNISPRGFTGHEHLDSVGLVHMNGRVYEPTAGRFLGVDPIVHVGLSQSSNRYAYVWNNPLTVIDPSGYDPPPDDQSDPCNPQCPPVFPTAPGPDDPLFYDECDWGGPWMAGWSSNCVVEDLFPDSGEGELDEGGSGNGVNQEPSDASKEDEESKDVTCSGPAPPSLREANQLWRNNAYADTKITVDASQLTFRQTTEFSESGTARAYAIGNARLTIGQVTLGRNKDASLFVAPDSYDFLPHDLSRYEGFSVLLGAARNVATYGAFVLASGFGFVEGTDFEITFVCEPIVVR